MWRWIRRNRSAMSTLAVLVICVTILFGVVASTKPRAYDYCPCGIGAAAVAATGAAITSFTVALITELYLVLWQGFAAVNGQINANTASFEEVQSYQTQAIANVERQRLAYNATMSSMRPATAGFQTTATTAAPRAQLNTDLVRDAILKENHEWQTNLSAVTAGSEDSNSALNQARRQSKYCNQRDAALDRCELPSDPRQIDADINADTIDPETLDEEMIGAAIDRCRNLVGMPSPNKTGTQYTTPSGKVEINAKMTGDARSLMTFAMCDYLVAIRTELPEADYRAWAEEVLKNITGGVGMAPPATASCFGGGGSLTPSQCNPIQAGFRFAGSTMNAQQASNLNALYSALASYNYGGRQLSHEAIMAIVMNTISETSAGTNMVEAIPGCRANPNGPTTCRAPYPSGSNAGRMYTATGIGAIQWSGWPGDSGPWESNSSGRGTQLAGLTNPETHQLFEKCSLVPNSSGGCGGTNEQAMHNNGLALIATIDSDPRVRDALLNASDINEAARVATDQLVRPAHGSQRKTDIAVAFQSPTNGLGSGGQCQGSDPLSAYNSDHGGDHDGHDHEDDDDHAGESVDPNPIPGNPVLARTPPPSEPLGPSQTNLTMPMRAPAYVNSCFGYRQSHPIYGDARPHLGADLVTTGDTTIYAAGSGEILYARPNGGYGNQVAIRHPNGYITYYSHLSSFSSSLLSQIAAGNTTIVAGTPLGVMGATGNVTGPHLHFEVKQESTGLYINPSFVVAGFAAVDKDDCGSVIPMYAQSKTEQIPLAGRTPPDLTYVGDYAGALPLDGMAGAGGGSCPTADLGINPTAESISHLELLKIVSEYRFMDPKWTEFVLTEAHQTQVIRDFLAIRATQYYLGWEAYDRQVQTAGVVAAWAAAEVDRAYRTKTGDHSN